MGTIQINYRIDEDLLNRIKDAAKARGIKYTSWMIDAAIAYLDDSKVLLNNSNSE